MDAANIEEYQEEEEEEEEEENVDAFGNTGSCELPLETAGIVMVSYTESPEEGGRIDGNALPREDVFLTRPEGKSRSQNSESAVDLGRVGDLGFSSEAEIESTEIRVSETEGNLGISLFPSKRLKISDEERNGEHPIEEIRLNEEVLESNTEAGFLVRKSVDEFDRADYYGEEMDAGGKCELPSSGMMELGDEEALGGKELEGETMTLLDVLKLLAEGCCYERCMENLSVLEAARRRGMTFP